MLVCIAQSILKDILTQPRNVKFKLLNKPKRNSVLLSGSICYFKTQKKS